ncbi:MAG: MopE-related protein [Myxococcota bacterium]
MRPTSVLFLLILFPACLADSENYERLRAELADADGDGWDIRSGDCDDANPAVHPANADGCDGVNQDCDDATDEDVDRTWYLDADGDTFGVTGSAIRSCTASRGWAAAAGDCDDDNPGVFPGAIERCDLVDEDCNGTADDGFPTQEWYPDDDRDDHGDPAGGIYTCTAPEGYVTSAEDCDDTNGAIEPDASEVCADGIDNNCDGAAVGCDWAGEYLTEDDTFSLLGVSAAGGAGNVVVTADVNGDTFDDVVIGSAAGLGVWVVSGDERDDVLLNTRDPLLTMTPHPSDFGPAFLFGQAVAVCDDGAGAYDIVIAGSEAGVQSFLFVFDGTRTGSLDTGSGSVLDSIPAPADLLGATMLCADLDADGVSDLVIGTPGYDTESATNTGALHIVPGGVSSGGSSRTDLGGSSASSTIGEDSGQALGGSIALGDVDADGVPDLLAGSADAGVPDAGLAWLLPGPIAEGATLYADAALRLVGPSSGAGAVAAGDLDGDGLDDIVVGAPDDESGWTGGGAVYVLYGDALADEPGGTVQVAASAGARLTGSSAGMHLGATVAVSPGADGAPGRLVVGAILDDGAGPDAGAVYLWDGVLLAGNVQSSTATAVWRGAAAGDHLGTAIELGGDLDADGYLDLLLGAPGYDGPAGDAGAVHVFLGSGL